MYCDGRLHLYLGLLPKPDIRELPGLKLGYTAIFEIAFPLNQKFSVARDLHHRLGDERHN